MNNHTSLPEQIVAAIRSVVGPNSAVLHEPSFAGNGLAYLKECIDTTVVSPVEKFVDRFEAGLVAFAGAKHVEAIMNGTAALHVALKLGGGWRAMGFWSPRMGLDCAIFPSRRPINTPSSSGRMPATHE